MQTGCLKTFPFLFYNSPQVDGGVAKGGVAHPRQAGMALRISILQAEAAQALGVPLCCPSVPLLLPLLPYSPVL